MSVNGAQLRIYRLLKALIYAKPELINDRDEASGNTALHVANNKQPLGALLALAQEMKQRGEASTTSTDEKIKERTHSKENLGTLVDINDEQRSTAGDTGDRGLEKSVAGKT